jgi:hypothetical protein
MTRRAVTLGDTVVVSPHQVSTALGRETVILGVETGHYLGLNEVGARIWDMVQQPVRVSALCEAIMDEYEVTSSECSADVLQLLRELEDKGLIHVQVAAGAP